MGNRAIIKGKDSDLGIYVHWNGGRDSVEAFLEYASFVSPHSGLGDKHYDSGLGILMTIIVNFMGSGTSVDVTTARDYQNPDHLDNGIYVVEGWEIIDRIAPPMYEQDSYDRREMLIAIDQAQSEKLQRGVDYIDSEIVDAADLVVGDEIVQNGIGGGVEKFTVLHLGNPDDLEKTMHHPPYSPYIGKYGTDNPNSYVSGAVRRVKKVA